FLILAVPRKQERELQVRVAGFRIQLDGAAKRRNRVVEVAFPDPQGATERLVRHPVLWLEPNRLFDFPNGFVDLAQVEQTRSEPMVGIGKIGVERDRAALQLGPLADEIADRQERAFETVSAAK